VSWKICRISRILPTFCHNVINANANANPNSNLNPNPNLNPTPNPNPKFNPILNP